MVLGLNAWAIFEQIHVATGYQFGFLKSLHYFLGRQSLIFPQQS